MILRVDLLSPFHVVGKHLLAESSLSGVDIVLSISGLEGVERVFITKAGGQRDSEQNVDNALHSLLKVFYEKLGCLILKRSA